MTERPLLFSGDMIRALLAGTKTQTRRLGTRYAKWRKRDLVWVRETWSDEADNEPPGVVYRATDPGWDDEGSGLKWKPSIFMPRSASRITLRLVEDVRQERLQAITEADALAEGANRMIGSSRDAYSLLWDAINTKPGTRWADNPIVNVLTFEVLA